MNNIVERKIKQKMGISDLRAYVQKLKSRTDLILESIEELEDQISYLEQI